MGAPADDEAAPPNSVLGKAQLLLAAFESGAFQLRLTELSRRSGVPKASAYRLAQELVRWGLLERHGDSYQLGMRMFELGERVLASASLRSVARPLLTDLYTSTRATIHLAVLDGAHVLYLEKIAGRANVHSHSQVGGRLPAWCTATGKVLLAVSPSGREQVERLAETGLPSLTERTVVSVDVLRRQLAVVAERGFALEVGETLSGYGSLAVPVTGESGTVHAAVSATGPAAQVTAQRLLPELRATAESIARAMDRHTPTRAEGHVSPKPATRSARRPGTRRTAGMSPA
ncbi:IclR family transcriptional regulator [Streptomyces mayteni]